jgi:hypothetical protein
LTKELTYLRNKAYVVRRDSQHVFDCYVLHYYLSWYCHLAMEKGVYMDELQPIQDYDVCRQALHLLVQINHQELETIKHENSKL